MDSSGLNSEQVAKLVATSSKYLRWLNKLMDRMLKQRFPDHDPLRIAAAEARQKAYKLVTAAHLAGKR